MAIELHIEGKSFGSKKPPFLAWSLPLDEGNAEMRLDKLIERIVVEEVKNFKQRREDRKLIHYLTSKQIAEGITAGKISMGGREEEEGDIDDATAIQTAIQAFKDGLYYVFVNDEQIEQLDTIVKLTPQTNVTFLKLIALAGG